MPLKFRIRRKISKNVLKLLVVFGFTFVFIFILCRRNRIQQLQIGSEIIKLVENSLDHFQLEDEAEIIFKRNSFEMEFDEDFEKRACKLPRFNPFEHIALKLIRLQTIRKKYKVPKCISDPSYKFRSDAASNKLIKIREKRTDNFWKESQACCYLPFSTDDNYKHLVNMTSCIDITQDETTIPIEYSNINVLCFGKKEVLTYRDYFHFFRLNQTIEEKLQDKEDLTRSDGSDHLSLIFLGLDSVSLTNFQRFLPKTRNYLVQNMSAFEFIGLNKVGRGTMENLVPVLSGCPYVNGKTVFPKPKEDCYLIWEKFKEKGYRTALSEEQFWTLAYREVKHKKNGKHNMDYSNLPFIKGIQSKWPYALGTYGCFANQFAPDLWADRIIQIAKKLEHKLYYQHLWSALTSHDVIEYAKYLDAPFYGLLKTLNEERLINNTVIILYSDHGTVSSDYSRTPEGLIEARLPLLYMVFPLWFQKKYSDATRNLKLNTQALVSPFDLHQTLLDLLDLKQITNLGLELRRQPSQNPPSPNKSTYGISLFRQIPFNRTCENGHIPEEYCICWSWTQMDNPNKDINVVKAVSFTLDSMNKIIDKHYKCIRLDLEKILDGKHTLDKNENVVYEISFQVIPSHGIFGAVVKVESVTPEGQIQFKILGEVERQNRYGNQSRCLSKQLQESGWIRSACYCR